MVGDDHHAHALVSQHPQQLHQLTATGGIEAAGRLVEHQHLWPAHQLQGHRGAFALASGQPRHDGAAMLAETEFGQHFIRPRLHLLAGRVGGAAQHGRQHHRFQERQFTVDDVVLGHVADFDVLPLCITGVQQRAALMTSEAVEHLHEGALACARRTDNADNLTPT